jgi:trafficking kinesin-binding protein 1
MFNFQIVITVLHLLCPQKEKDLELTARIGQELLTHNNQLETQVAALEVQLKEVHDRLEQTQHELHSKAELLAILAAEDDTSDPSNKTNQNKSLNIDNNLLHIFWL